MGIQKFLLFCGLLTGAAGYLATANLGWANPGTGSAMVMRRD